MIGRWYVAPVRGMGGPVGHHLYCTTCGVITVGMSDSLQAAHYFGCPEASSTAQSGAKP